MTVKSDEYCDHKIKAFDIWSEHHTI